MQKRLRWLQMSDAYPPLALNLPQTLCWENDTLKVLDQRKLPHQITYWELHSLEDAWHAIQTLAVRGAPAIGVAAGYALAQSMLHSKLSDAAFAKQLRENGAYLQTARPTAVNLAWAIDQIIRAYLSSGERASLVECARQIHQRDLAICEAIGQHGTHLITPDSGVLTHCNAGSLATSRYGTATAPMYTAHARGVPFRVYADETRPLYQGARLTAWELEQAGVPVTLICDNMAATLMAAGDIQIAIVGTDRVTANGDVVNKIGTLNVAILCNYYQIPFYVACPSSTFDAQTPGGQDVIIEQRSAAEVNGEHANARDALNPAFDITPARLVSGIITEYGIYKPENLRDALQSEINPQPSDSQ